MKKLTLSQIKKIMETNLAGERSGVFINKEEGYVSNGCFMIKNVFDINYKVSKRNNMFTPYAISTFRTTIYRNTTKHVFTKLDGDVAYFGEVAVRLSFLRVMYRSVNKDKFILEDQELLSAKYSDMLSYLGLPITKLKIKE